MIGARDVDRSQALRRLEMGGDGGIVDGFVHRDVVKLALGRGIVERGQDRVDEVVDMDEVALERAPVRVAKHGEWFPLSGSARRPPGSRASSSPGRRTRRQLGVNPVLLRERRESSELRGRDIIFRMNRAAVHRMLRMHYEHADRQAALDRAAKLKLGQRQVYRGSGRG